MITTIIPTYRRPQMLKKAIHSVLAQEYPHLQVCVYDNASGDETAEIVAEIAKRDPRVHYHCHSQNIGMTANFQYGLAHVTTPFYSFLSDDDFLLPWFYAEAMQNLERFADAAIFAGSSIVMNEKGKITHVGLTSWEKEGYYAALDSFKKVLQGDFPPWTSLVFRKEIQGGEGDVLDQETGIAFDVDFLLRKLARFPLVISKKPCAIFFRHPNACSYGKTKVEDIWPGWQRILAKLKDYTMLPVDLRREAERVLSLQAKSYLFHVALNMIVFKNFKEAIEVATLFEQVFNMSKKAFLIKTAAKLCQSSCLIHRLFVFAKNNLSFLLRVSKLAKIQKLQSKYREFATLLSHSSHSFAQGNF